MSANRLAGARRSMVDWPQRTRLNLSVSESCRPGRGVECGGARAGPRVSTRARGRRGQAEEALKDPDYYAGLVAYGREVDRITRPIWESEYIEPERERVREQENDAGE